MDCPHEIVLEIRSQAMNSIGFFCKGCRTLLREKLMSDENANPVITFGKHRGQALKDVAQEDPSYLHWLAKQLWCKAEMRKAIESLT